MKQRTKQQSKRNTQPDAPMGDMDVYWFKEGTHARLYDKLGAHLIGGDKSGSRFAVWAPNAEAVTVVGDFNGWNHSAHALNQREDGSGVWEGVVAEADQGARYKYSIRSRHGGYHVNKSDPYALYCEEPPATASRVWSLDYQWQDSDWMLERGSANALDAPQSIYELHLGSWMRVVEEHNRFLTYRELAERLVDYIAETGFTHVELMPVTEHPFYGSWGYQTTGYFAPTARYGTPQDFMFLVDTLHQHGIGVILDWVPAHFPSDEHGLVYFDGTHLYEHADPRQGFHPEWNSYIFNYGRNEVRAFLLSSALFWLDKYHVDGLRVDGVSSMLYLDYARQDGEWISNQHGGRENLQAIALLRQLNETVYREHPDTEMIAEESTAWPMVSRPTYLGGLGFGLKWNMGWMHDTLDYLAHDPIYRKHHHGQLAFSIWYAFNENFVLALSHDEVVYGKGSLLRKLPGDEALKFAGLRGLFGYMWGHPGKKLTFMGSEFGQWNEWNHDRSLDWHLLEHPSHAGLKAWIGDLNRFLRAEPALYQRDFVQEGFAWLEAGDWENSCLSFLRHGSVAGDTVLIVCNFTPIVRENYRVGVPSGGWWRECLNSDATEYGGFGHGNLSRIDATPIPIHGQYHSLMLTLPPLGTLFLKPEQGSLSPP